MRARVRQLKKVIPGLLAAVCLMDIGSRFMSIDPLTFRPWEALVRYRPPDAPFEPNRTYYNKRAYGDLAALGNLPQFRQYRTERFTTDTLGYRNAPHVVDEEVSAILVGDSFGLGLGVNDNETLSSKLSTPGGCIVYNASSSAFGRVGRGIPDEILGVAHRLHLRNRLVIRVYAEDSGVPAPDTPLQKRMRKLVASTPAVARHLVGRLKGLIEVSPLRMLSGRALRTVGDDEILPNADAPSVMKATLSNGDSILFLTSEADNFYRRREVTMGYWRWLRDGLRPAHFDLMVVLVPSKYRVYRRFLVNPQTLGREGNDYPDRLEQALKAEGIPVLNLTSLLSDKAARDLEHGKYLFLLDDVHWNARGIALAARAIRNSWPLREASCARPFTLAARSRSH